MARDLAAAAFQALLAVAVLCAALGLSGLLPPLHGWGGSSTPGSRVMFPHTAAQTWAGALLVLVLHGPVSMRVGQYTAANASSQQQHCVRAAPGSCRQSCCSWTRQACAKQRRMYRSQRVAAVGTGAAVTQSVAAQHVAKNRCICTSQAHSRLRGACHWWRGGCRLLKCSRRHRRSRRSHRRRQQNPRPWRSTCGSMLGCGAAATHTHLTHTTPAKPYCPFTGPIWWHTADGRLTADPLLQIFPTKHRGQAQAAMQLPRVQI